MSQAMMLPRTRPKVAEEKARREKPLSISSMAMRRLPRPNPMTGLPNARSLQARFESEIARARRTGSRFQILMIDLDGFKSVNDSFGHKTGDLLLKELSDRMKSELREYDFLARYAGDEFVVIVPEADLVAAHELSHRLEQAVGTFRLEVGEGRFASVGASIGIASYPSSGETLDQVVIAADKAMYAVKESRKLRAAKHALQTEKDEFFPEPLGNDRDEAMEVHSLERDEEALIVELDERHVISSRSVN